MAHNCSDLLFFAGLLIVKTDTCLLLSLKNDVKCYILLGGILNSIFLYAFDLLYMIVKVNVTYTIQLNNL